MNNKLKNTVFSSLKNPFFEKILIFIIDLLPASSQSFLKKAVPQPYNYNLDEYRIVTRHDCKWKLFLGEYFQWNQYYKFEEPNLEQLLKYSKNAKTILDVGANIGFLSVLMAKNSKVGRVISFEPHPKTFARLKMHTEMNQLANLSIENIALSNVDGEAELFDWAEGDSGKFSLRANEGGVTKLNTKIKKLDTYCRENKIAQVDLIKIDVEGFEPEMLAGGKETIEKGKPILVIEFSPKWYKEKLSLTKDVIQWLYSLNYKFYKVENMKEVDLLQEMQVVDQINVIGTI